MKKIELDVKKSTITVEGLFKLINMVTKRPACGL